MKAVGAHGTVAGIRRSIVAALFVVGLVAPAPPAAADPAVDRMRADLAAVLAGGPREAGTDAEWAASNHVAATLAAMGLPVGRELVALPNGRHSNNVETTIGSGPIELLLGAHLDSVRGSPGADDNGSGVVVLLELARRLVASPPPADLTVHLVWFGAEEVLHGFPRSAHHFGSRQLAARLAGAGVLPHWMVSVDMVGFGAALHAVGFAGTDPTAAVLLERTGDGAGVPTGLMSAGDISDHEAFARRGVPAAFLWRPDNPGYHGPGDTTVADAPLLADLVVLEAFVAAAASPLASHRGAVHQLVVDLLGRRPDLGGTAFWTGLLDRGQSSRGAVGANLFASPEWAAAVAPIGRLYLAAFGRDGDHGGLSFWSGRIRAGTGLEAIGASFVAAPEFASLYGSPSDSQFVALLYQNVLGRSPDAGGEAYWTGQLGSGRSRASVLASFSESSEHRQRTGAGLPVALAYAGLLRRAVDPAGAAFWTGRPLDQLVAGLVSSPEWAARFG